MRKPQYLWFVFAICLLLTFVLALSCGRYPVSFSAVWHILYDTIFGNEMMGNYSRTEQNVVLNVRLPRVLIAGTAGAGLAVAGAALQGIFRNPLVGPQIIGVSSGAALGGALAILLFSSLLITISLAFIGGLLAIVLVFLLGLNRQGSQLLMLILAGVIINAFFAALISLITYFADPNNTLQTIVFWLMGSFASASYLKLNIVFPVVLVCVLVIFALRFRINVLSLGEENAQALGMKINRTRWAVLLSVTLITSATVAVSGTIGWVGLIVPHIARLMVGHDHRILLPASAVIGGIYMVAVDTFARSMTNAEIPLSVITALIGAPIFALLIHTLNKKVADL
ncbi:iron ABC transporter permease [Providencia rettgeri]|uniref:Iron ABC transporter permease n=1 Tax=Providencia rettgeri TaxID=587 RepID=A0AAW6UFN7_PRORE|nr:MULTISPECIES: iron ABC transporter permease [Providencia]MBG5894298.1 iron ABC transporter permease [Providencia rettgeri]MBQ0531531.1 iron ABC transporter permease [Providencia rettgeri]MDI9094073.1 iron ABC transporter permease [Providencia rettgeri]MDT2038177.1 iron ABC transporter permease [Providencia rettgeri]WOB85403.1 iron ABC transporter permease [Providencia sp. PROV040]